MFGIQTVKSKSCVWTVFTCSYLKSVTIYKESFLGGNNNCAQEKGIYA